MDKAPLIGKESLESLLSNVPIPEGFVRLTHFTSREIAQQILEGKLDFQYFRSLIDQTADVHGYIEQVYDTVSKGIYRQTQRRDNKGHCVILIDIDIDEWVARNRAHNEETIPNKNILGFIDTDKTEFQINPDYNPTINVVTVPSGNGMPIPNGDGMPVIDTNRTSQVFGSDPSNYDDIW